MLVAKEFLFLLLHKGLSEREESLFSDVLEAKAGLRVELGASIAEGAMDVSEQLSGVRIGVTRLGL